VTSGRHAAPGAALLEADVLGSPTDWECRLVKEVDLRQIDDFVAPPRWPSGDHFSEKMRFQSFFMLMTVQPFCFASSYSAWVKVPTLVSGRPCAGP